MKFNEKQAAAWNEIGEALLEMWVRVTDLSLPDDVVLDQAWLATTLKGLTKRFDVWSKTLPGVQRNNENALRRKNRARKAATLMPKIFQMLMSEVKPASDSGIGVNFAMEMEIVERPPPGAGLTDAEIAEIEAMTKKKPDGELN